MTAAFSGLAVILISMIFSILDACHKTGNAQSNQSNEILYVHKHPLLSIGFLPPFVRMWANRHRTGNTMNAIIITADFYVKICHTSFP